MALNSSNPLLSIPTENDTINHPIGVSYGEDTVGTGANPFLPYTPPPPGPAPEPTMDEILTQSALQDAEDAAFMRPYVLGQAGFVEDNGTIRPMTQQELYGNSVDDPTGVSQYSPYSEPAARTNYWVNRAATDQQLKYSRGEGTTPDAIESNLKTLADTGESQIRQRLGARGGLLSTPGIKATSDINATATGVRGAYAFGNETQGLGLLSQGYSNMANNQNAWNANSGAFLNGGTGLPGMGIQSQQPYLAQNNLNTLSDSLQRQKSNAIQGGLLGGVGSMASMYLTKGMGGKS